MLLVQLQRYPVQVEVEIILGSSVQGSDNKLKSSILSKSNNISISGLPTSLIIFESPKMMAINQELRIEVHLMPWQLAYGEVLDIKCM